MGGGGLLICYVTNVACYKSYPSAFSYILYDIFVHFVRYFPAQKPYLCTEFQSALKFQTNMLIVNWHMLIGTC